MFDPTAFDNMKVVIEGALYDRDISGEIVIVDRNDCVNMAKMSRQFDVSFRLSDSGSSVAAKFAMESHLANLAAELLPDSQLERFAGCHIKLDFVFEQGVDAIDYEVIGVLFREIWGTDRQITQFVCYNPLESEDLAAHTITVEFGRLIGENQMDDLVEMIEFIVKTLDQLESMIPKK